MSAKRGKPEPILMLPEIVETAIPEPWVAELINGHPKKPTDDPNKKPDDQPPAEGDQPKAE